MNQGYAILSILVSAFKIQGLAIKPICLHSLYCVGLVSLIRCGVFNEQRLSFGLLCYLWVYSVVGLFWVCGLCHISLTPPRISLLSPRYGQRAPPLPRFSLSLRLALKEAGFDSLVINI